MENEVAEVKTGNHREDEQPKPEEQPPEQPYIEGRLENDGIATWNILGRWYREDEVEQVHRQNKEREAKWVREQKAIWAETPQGQLCLELYQKFCEYKKYLDDHPWARKRHDGAKVNFPEHNLFEEALVAASDYHREREEKDRRNLERAQLAARCQHAYLDGDRCGAPRLKGKTLCRMHERMEEAKALKLDLGTMEDADSIQVGIMKLQRAVIDGTLDAKQIGHLAYLIQIAAWNVTRTSSGTRELTDGEDPDHAR
jgi:hypothetical protein